MVTCIQVPLLLGEDFGFRANATLAEQQPAMMAFRCFIDRHEAIEQSILFLRIPRTGGASMAVTRHPRAGRIGRSRQPSSYGE
jgi:hypothetical protein